MDLVKVDLLLHFHQNSKSVNHMQYMSFFQFFHKKEREKKRRGKKGKKKGVPTKELTIIK